MINNINIQRIDGKSRSVTISSFPQFCPVCNNNQFPKLLNGYDNSHIKDKIQLTFLCTNPKCETIFFGTYDLIKNSGHYILINTEPKHPKKRKFSEQIENISPQFSNIYNQSITAEGTGLDQLTGIGLRKALEFLIKDFAGHINEAKKQKILKASLSQCIENYIDDANIKSCAKLASWLGNDETHYIKKWEDKDISDLKLLIKLTVNWVDNYLLTEKYKSEMLSESNIDSENS